MTDSTAYSGVEQRCLHEYEVYDQHVDVVSAMEWMFTGVENLAATVAHFERFPRIPIEGLRDPLRPDFTILFRDGSAIVGECARIALHDGSIEKLCKQIGKYADLTRVPGPSGDLVEVHRLDVMQMVDVRTGLEAIKRVIKDRYLNPDHPYKPPRAPCIVQFVRSDADYVFQHLPDPENGGLYSGSRDPHIGDYLKRGLSVQASRFSRIKAQRVFVNDPIKPLYLATHLWTRAWPSQHGGARGTIDVDEQSIAQDLRRDYGTGLTSDVRQALELLQQARLASPVGRGAWKVNRILLGRSGERDVHKIIAKRAGEPAPQPSKRRAAPQVGSPQERLF